MSGRDGSIGYSFFIIGDEIRSDGETGETGDEDKVGEEQVESVIETHSFDSGFVSNSSSDALIEVSFGGVTIKSTAFWPLASSIFGSAPSDKRSLTVSTALTEPPAAAEWRAVQLSFPADRFTSTSG
jgi:hypothetical protein